MGQPIFMMDGGSARRPKDSEDDNDLDESIRRVFFFEKKEDDASFRAYMGRVSTYMTTKNAAMRHEEAQIKNVMKKGADYKKFKCIGCHKAVGMVFDEDERGFTMSCGNQCGYRDFIAKPTYENVVSNRDYIFTEYNGVIADLKKMRSKAMAKLDASASEEKDYDSKKIKYLEYLKDLIRIDEIITVLAKRFEPAKVSETDTTNWYAMIRDGKMNEVRTQMETHYNNFKNYKAAKMNSRLTMRGDVVTENPHIFFTHVSFGKTGGGAKVIANNSIGKPVVDDFDAEDSEEVHPLTQVETPVETTGDMGESTGESTGDMGDSTGESAEERVDLVADGDESMEWDYVDGGGIQEEKVDDIFVIE